MRKTLDRKQVVITVNGLLEQITKQAIVGVITYEQARDQRQPLIIALESLLMQHDSYKGFRYMATEWDAENERLRDGYDDLARQYYY